MMPGNIPYQPQNRGTAVFLAFDYLIGLGVMGFLYYILNLILPSFEVISATGTVHDLANMIWTGVLIMYLVFGPFWFWNKLKEYDR